jgi:hypothetical protein
MKHCALLAVFLSFRVFTFAAGRDSISRAINRSGPKYVAAETGFGISSFRDLATSPLFYSGTPAHFRLSFLKENQAVIRQLSLRYAFGTYRSEVGRNGSRVNSFFIDYMKLWQLESLRAERWRFDAGGTLAVTTSVRNNPSLQNNAIGLDFFGNAMATIRITRDLSRTAPDPKRFIFIRYGRKEKDRDISLRLSGGLLNFNYRNGFIYTQQYQVVNQSDYFENYALRLSGLRFGSRLAFTRRFATGNAIRFAYDWDAYRTSYKSQTFEMAHHSISFALLFRTK